MKGRILRLYPPPQREVGAIHSDLDLAPAGWHEPPRPYVILNMVTSLDGRAAVEGKGGGIGSESDRQAMRALRARADAVMVGAGTLRAEKLTLGLEGPDQRQPMAVVLTTTGDIALDNLLVRGSQKILVVTARDAPENLSGQLQERVLVFRASRSPSGTIDLRETLTALRMGFGVEVLLVEGGPRLNHAMISAQLADELFLTLAPKLLGGTQPDSPTILTGPALATRGASLLSVHLAEGELFLRYHLDTTPDSA